MTAQKPATPLPWKLGTRYPTRILGVGATSLPEDESHASPKEKDDAAYLVHAANAYPKLVAALRRILHNPNASIGGEIRAETIGLLRELGELE